MGRPGFVEGLGPQFHPAHDNTCEGHDRKDNPDCGGGAEGTLVEVTLMNDIDFGPQRVRLSTDNGAQVAGFTCCSFFADLDLKLSDGEIAACRIENTSELQNDVQLRASLAAFLKKDIGDDENTAGNVNFTYGMKPKKTNGGLSFGWFEPDGEPDAGKRIRVDVDSDDVTHDGTRTTFTFAGGVGGVEEIKVSRSIPGATLSERDRLFCQYSGLNLELDIDRTPL